MNRRDIRKAMDQIHISAEMQEEMIANIQEQMLHGKKKTWSRKKAMGIAAALVLTAGLAAVPVRALVKDLVEARMEQLPKEDVEKIEDMIQEQSVEADSFSREYSDTEKKRSKELWQSYENGMFPEKEIVQVDQAGGAPEGILCYIRDIGEFQLPDREMTDEELLEIIDFQHMMSYALWQGRTAREAREEYEAEQARLEGIVQAAGGISREEAIRIARAQMEAELGAEAKRKELLTDGYGGGVSLVDLSDQTDSAGGGVAYDISFTEPEDDFIYKYWIDASDGNVLDVR